MCIQQPLHQAPHWCSHWHHEHMWLAMRPAQGVRSELLCWAGHHHQIHANIYIVEVLGIRTRTCRVARHSPLATSHTRTELSLLELAINAPSGLNATPVTQSEWPCKRSIITGCKRTSASGCVRPLPAGQRWCGAHVCVVWSTLGRSLLIAAPPLHKCAQPPLLLLMQVSPSQVAHKCAAGWWHTHSPHIPCTPPALMHQPT